MNGSWNKILQLVAQSGDRFIFKENENDFVVMNLEEYEKLIRFKEQNKDLLELSEEELVDKINQDIAEWRANQQLSSDFYTPEKEKEDENDETDDQYYLEPVEP